MAVTFFWRKSLRMVAYAIEFTITRYIYSTRNIRFERQFSRKAKKIQNQIFNTSIFQTEFFFLFKLNNHSIWILIKQLKSWQENERKMMMADATKRNNIQLSLFDNSKKISVN